MYDDAFERKGRAVHAYDLDDAFVSIGCRRKNMARHAERSMSCGDVYDDTDVFIYRSGEQGARRFLFTGIGHGDTERGRLLFLIPCPLDSILQHLS